MIYPITNESEQSKLVGQIIDGIEDVLTEDTDFDVDEPLIKGDLYDRIASHVKATLRNWNLFQRMTVPEKHLHFIVIGPEEPVVRALIKMLQDENGWDNSEWDEENHCMKDPDAEIYRITADTYMPLMESKVNENTQFEIVFIGPRKGFDTENRFIWSSETERQAFEPIVRHIMDNTECKDFYVPTDDLDAWVKVAAYHIRHIANLYKCYNHILDDMLKRNIIPLTDPVGNKLALTEDGTDTIPRQLLISEFVRNFDENDVMGHLVTFFNQYFSYLE